MLSVIIGTLNNEDGTGPYACRAKAGGGDLASCGK